MKSNSFFNPFMRMHTEQKESQHSEMEKKNTVNICSWFIHMERVQNSKWECWFDHLFQTNEKREKITKLQIFWNEKRSKCDSFECECPIKFATISIAIHPVDNNDERVGISFNYWNGNYFQ